MIRSSTPIRQATGMRTHIDIYHQMIHEGLAFKVSHLFKAVADDAYAIMLIRNGKKELHITPTVGAGGKAYITLLEDVEVSAFGTSVTPRNQNRECIRDLAPEANEGTWVRAYHTPTISDAGTEIDEAELFAASKQADRVGGASANLGAEYVIAPGALYALQVQNKSGDATDIEIRIIYYEYKEQ